MANFKKHVAVGAACGAALCLAVYWNKKAHDPSVQFDWGEFLLLTGLGALAATLPDMLEPAISPFHRSFFHSVAAGTLVSHCSFGKHTEAMQPEMKNLLSATGLGYLSHLALDSLTPMGIRMI